jgi:hypothetical protein
MDDADLSDLELPERPYKSETFYGKNGIIVDEQAALIKVLIVGKWEKFFIWFWRGELFDPYGPDILRKSQQTSAKFKPVPKEVFELYLKYLKSKNRIFFTRARRLAMEVR